MPASGPERSTCCRRSFTGCTPVSIPQAGFMPVSSESTSNSSRVMGYSSCSAALALRESSRFPSPAETV